MKKELLRIERIDEVAEEEEDRLQSPDFEKNLLNFVIDAEKSSRL